MIVVLLERKEEKNSCDERLGRTTLVEGHFDYYAKTSTSTLHLKHSPYFALDFRPVSETVLLRCPSTETSAASPRTPKTWNRPGICFTGNTSTPKQ